MEKPLNSCGDRTKIEGKEQEKSGSFMDHFWGFWEGLTFGLGFKFPRCRSGPRRLMFAEQIEIRKQNWKAKWPQLLQCAGVSDWAETLCSGHRCCRWELLVYGCRAKLS